MPETTAALKIVLLAADMKEFEYHFDNEFCQLDTFKPLVPELLWVERTNAFHGDFDYEARRRKMTRGERDRDCGINVLKEDYVWERKPVPYVTWEIQGFGNRRTPVTNIKYKLTVFRYRTDQLRVVLEDESIPNTEVSEEVGLPERPYKIEQLIQIFLDWLKPRWEYVDESEPVLRSQTTTQETTRLLPQSPPLPGTDGFTWDDVFDWWYRGGRLNYPNLKKLAYAASAAYGTVKNRHTDYKVGYGTNAKPDSESKFAGMSQTVTKGHSDE